MAAAQESRLELAGVGSADPPCPGAAAASRNGTPTLQVNGDGKRSSTSARTGSHPDILLLQQGWYLVAKDGLDRVLALLLLVMTAPLLFAAMILVRVTSRGPAVYSQTRVGRLGKPFTIYKLRSMIVESESLT